MNKMKNKIFVINLESAEDRKKTMISQFKKYGISNYEFIKAVKSSEINYDKQLPEEIDREHLGEKYRKYFNKTETACLQSHIKAIKKAKENDLDYVIILEDDVVLCEDWNKRLEKLFKVTPKSWNHIYLSGMPDEETQRKTFQPLNLAPFLHVERSIYTMGAFSYILKSDVYDDVITSLEHKNLPVDDVIKDMVVNNELKSYTFYPFLTYHDNEIPSTIWDKEIWEREYNVNHDSVRFFVNKL